MMCKSTMSAIVWKRLLAATFCVGCWLGLILAAAASDVGDRLEKGFLSPPASARPHTWFHWMNGNVTKEGITADLEAMQRVGIGGFQVFNPLEGIPDGPAPYMSPQWLDMMKFAAVEADRLGLEMCFHNCAGWSSSGGPWIKPAQAMQTVVISEKQVKGPANFDAVLPQPHTNCGYYRDIAVVAFPTPKEKGTIDRLPPKTLSQQEYDYGVQPDTKSGAGGGGGGEGEHRRSDLQTRQRWQAGMGRARGQLDDPPHRPHADRRAERSGCPWPAVDWNAIS